MECESGGEIFTVEADQIAVKAGAIASPQLLLLSGVGPAAKLENLGIEVVQDLPEVGQNLRDHPYVLMFFREAGQALDVSRQPCVQVILLSTGESIPTLYSK